MMKKVNKNRPAIWSLAIIAFSFFACSEQTEPPAQTISYEEAKVLEQEFIQTRAKIINEYLGYEDTREFWFSLDTIKKYIDYVEREGKAKGYKNMGLRIYYGAYPKNMEDKRVSPGYSTVFIVPTTQEPSLMKSGFLPMQPDNANAEGIDGLNYGHGGQPPRGL